MICPIGNEFAPVGDAARERWERSIEIWEKVIEPACIANDIDVVRADQIAKPGEITEQVFTQLRDCELVIADITGGNPNVMYELGLRHAVGKSTIQIGEFGQLPFDIAGVRTSYFARTPAGLVDGRKKLEAAIAVALESGVDHLAATRVLRPEAGPVLPTAEQNAPLIEIQSEEPGVFELLAAMESDMPELGRLAERSSDAMQRITALAQDATAEIQRGDTLKQGFVGRLRVANKLASQLMPIADEFEQLASAYEERLTTVNAGMTCLLDLFDENPTQLDEAKEFTSQIQSFVAIVKDATESQASFASSFAVPGKFSKPLRISTRRIAEATRRIGKALAIAELWGSRLHQMSERRRAAQGVD